MAEVGVAVRLVASALPVTPGDPRRACGRQDVVRPDRAGATQWFRSFGWPSVVVLAFYATIVAVYFLVPLSGAARTRFFDGAYIPLDLAGIVLCFAAASSPRLSRRTRQAWLLIGLGQLTYAFGDVAWFVIEGLLGQDPYPSMADVGYLAAYPFYFAGLLRFPVRKRTGREVVVLVLDVAVVVASAFLVMWSVVLGRAVDAGATDLSGVLDIAYPLGDLVLVMGITAVMLGGVIVHQRPLRWLTAGFVTWVLADVMWNYVAETFVGGDWLDLIWLGALALIAIAADQQRSTIRTAQPEGPSHRDPLPRVNLLPYLAVLASYVVIFRAVLGLPFYPLGALLAADVLITVIVVIRQLLASFEHLALMRTHQRDAAIDPLTGLANRRALFAAAPAMGVGGAAREVSVLMIDVDRFKQLNDTFGHPVGDLALRAVADACSTAAGPGAVVARMGGDEFAIVLPDADGAAAHEVRRAIRTALPAAAAGVGLPSDAQLGCSVGVATAVGEPLEALLRIADQALYSAKKGHAQDLDGAPRTTVRAGPRGSSSGPVAAHASSGSRFR